MTDHRATALVLCAALTALLLGVLVHAFATVDPEPGTDAARSTATATPLPTSTTAAPTTTSTTTTSTTTSTTTTTEPVVVAAASEPILSTGHCGGHGDLIARYFPAEQVGNACKIAACESGHNPGAVSRTNDHGLFQINAGTASWPGGWRSTFAQVTGVDFYSGIYDAELNTRFAAWLWERSGWAPWSCRRAL